MNLRAPVTGYQLIAVLVTCVLLSVASFVSNIAFTRNSEQKFCSIAAANRTDTPATTERGKVLAEANERLYRDLRCEEKK